MGGPGFWASCQFAPNFSRLQRVKHWLAPTCSRFPYSLLGLLFKFLLQIALPDLSSFAMSVCVLKQKWPPSCIFRANASQLIASSPDDPEKVRELLTEQAWSRGRELARGEFPQTNRIPSPLLQNKSMIANVPLNEIKQLLSAQKLVACFETAVYIKRDEFKI